MNIILYLLQIILSPSSKEASFHYSENLLEKRNFDLHQVYRALEVLAKENDMIQKNFMRTPCPL